MNKDKKIHLNQLMFGSSKLSDLLTYITTHHFVDLVIAKDGENYIKSYENNALDTEKIKSLGIKYKGIGR